MTQQGDYLGLGNHCRWEGKIEVQPCCQGFVSQSQTKQNSIQHPNLPQIPVRSYHPSLPKLLVVFSLPMWNLSLPF